MASYRIEEAKWKAEKEEEFAAQNEEFRLLTLKRIEAGEPVDWFERFLAGLPA